MQLRNSLFQTIIFTLVSVYLNGCVLTVQTPIPTRTFSTPTLLPTVNPTTSQVIGVLTRENGKLAINVEVTLIDSQGREATKLTDAQGRFEFKDMAPGRYLLATREKECGGVAMPVDIEAGKAQTVNINEHPNCGTSSP